MNTGRDETKSTPPLQGIEFFGFVLCLALLPSKSTSFSAKSKVTPSIARPPLPGSHPEYPFENVVFQGGGARGSIYGGTAAALEDLGILPYLKRFAGASAGCFPAVCLALGLDSKQIQEEMLNLDLTTFFDGYFLEDVPGIDVLKNAGPVYNVLDKMGMHPAAKITEAIGDLLERYTGNSELTFLDLYRDYGVELCVTVSNLSRSESNFCHINMTPSLPIKIAVRASMSLPLIFQPVKLYGVDELSVDGGLYNNYPIKAFDGWYLSTKKEDGILARGTSAVPSESSEDCLSAVREAFKARFDTINEATIGFRAFDDSDPSDLSYFGAMHVMGKLKEDGTSEMDKIPYPDTKKARAFLENKKKEEKREVESEIYKKAFAELNDWLLANYADIQQHEASRSIAHPHGISTTAIVDQLKKNPPNERFQPEVFGLDSWEEVVGELDKSKKGFVVRSDFSYFWDTYNVHTQQLSNRKPKKINSVDQEILQTIISLQLIQEGHILSEEENMARTCSLDCKYIGVLDFECEEEDKKFLFHIGEKTTKDWCKKRAAQLSSQESTKTRSFGFKLGRRRLKIGAEISGISNP
mmetsp:Transcript_20174/g.49480  ORF Transcript_20174/g.49480 Transcript_20174/m.49480 type:complete len:582 (+) Transcript_20174:110-1855(+)